MRKNLSLIQYAIWRIIFKWLPFVAGFIMMCHCFLLLNNVHTLFVGTSVGISVLWAIGFIAGSYTLRFCELHRLFTLYCLLVTFCINYEAAIGFGKYVMMARTIAFSIGLSLHIALAIRLYHHQRIDGYSEV